MLYEASHNEYSIGKFIEHYQNAMPQLVMIRSGYMGDSRSNTLDAQEVLRIHGVHSERRVLAKVTKDLSNCFGSGDVTISIPVTFPIPMCCVKKNGSLKTAKLLQNILKECKLPVTVQLMETTNHDILLQGMVVLLTDGVKLSLEKEYDEKYMYGNPVNNGQLIQDVISFPSCTPSITLSVITGLASHNDEHWQSILGSMDHTVTNDIKFDGKIGSTEILDCSSSDFNIKKLEDDRCKEPRRRHSLYTEVKQQDGIPSTLDEHIYDDLIEEMKTKSQRRFLDSLQPGNSNRTIPVSQSLPFSYCNMPNMSKRNPDHVDSTVIESASSKITDVVPSTKKTERRGGMVGGAKPSGQISFLDSLQPGNRNSSIPVSQSHPFSYCNEPDMGRRNPDHVDSTVIESATSKNADAVPSTKNTERRGGMVGGAKPSGQIGCLDSLQPGNRNSTIPVSQSHPFSYCNVPNMSNPDHVNSTVIESASGKNADAVPSTKNTERRGGMVGGAKPSGQIGCLDSLQPGNRNSTIPVSQSHPFSYCSVPNMSRRNPDHVDSTVIESASGKNADAVPSTKNTERRGGMVGGAKPFGQRSSLDSLQPGNIPVSQSHPFSYCNVPNMSRRNPDHVDSTVIESASGKNADAVPSTKNTEQRGGMVGGAKPFGQRSSLDSLQPGNIPVSQSHPFSYCNVPNMSRRNPDHVDSTVIESASGKNADAVPSTKNTERRGGMVGGAKPFGQRSSLDSLQPGNIPVSQSHPFSFCNVPNMSKKNPDHVDSTVIESSSSKNTDALPSTKKTERRGGMAGVVKPSGYKVKLQDVVRPPDIKIVKPVNSSFDIDSLLIQDLAEYLHILNIGQYAEKLADAQIDGILLKELDEQILIEEFGFKRFEAIKLMKFARHGYLPKPSK